MNFATRKSDSGSPMDGKQPIPVPHRHASLASDVRLVSSRRRPEELGFHRGARIVWLPRGLAMHVWEHGVVDMPSELSDLFDVQALIARSAANTAELPHTNERNANFLSAIGSGHARNIRGIAHASNVVIVGCGGVGSNLAVILGSFGFERMLLIDGDIIEQSNLNRLTWAGVAAIGKPKVQVLQAFLLEKFGLSVPAIAVPADTDAIKAIAALDASQLFVFALDDTMAVRNLVAELHHGTFVPYVQAGYSGSLCVVGPITDSEHGPCPFCDNDIEVAITSHFVAPSAAPNNWLIASFLAAQLLLKDGEEAPALVGKRWLFDLVSGDVAWQPIVKNPLCRVCG